MVKKRWSRWHLVWYPVAALVLADIAYQFLLSWHQANTIGRANPVLLTVAVFNQLLAYGAVVPAMRRFYARVGVQLSAWHTFSLVAVGLTAAKIIPAGEYIFWRLNFRHFRGGATATTQWQILYYTCMVGGLVLVFLLFEVATLVFYPHAAVQTLIGKVRYLPIGVTMVLLLALLTVRLPAVSQLVTRLAFDKFGNQAVSPLKIIRERKLDRDDVSALGFASLATWLLEAVTLYLCMLSLGVRVPFVIAIFGYAFARLFSFLPLVPGGIGEVEVGTVLFFSAYGYPVGVVFTATILYRLITYWPPIVIGLASYIGIKKSGDKSGVKFGAPQFAAELHRRQGFLP